ncbi:MAG: protein kinase [Acidobacteria bacterium]|nr:protein kinase [Acidobacteriota bacterium]
MPNCPECGEKVADLDTFCSYCGITLTPVAVASDEDPSMSPTIVGAPIGFVPVPEAPATADQLPIPSPIPSPFADSSAADPFAAAPVTPVSEPEKVAAIEPPIPSPVEPAPETDATDAGRADLESISVKPGIEDAVGAEAFVDRAAFQPEVRSDAPEEIPAAAPDAAVSAVDEAPVPQVILDLAAENPPKASEIGSEAAVPEVIEMPAATSEAPVVEAPIAHWQAESDLVEPSPAEETALPVIDLPVAAFAPESPLFEAPIVADSEPVETAPERELASPEIPVETEPAQVPISKHEFDSRSDEVFESVEPKEVPSLEAVSLPIPESPNIAVVESSEPAEPGAVRDQDSVVTLEAPAAEFPETPAAAVVPVVAAAEIAPSGEVRPSTKPNIGNGDTDGRRAAKLKPLDEGTLLNNRYEIVRKIGGGGMGAVYLANDRNLGGVLRAVKEMVQSYIESEQQEKAVADFQREAMILTNLEHPAIPTIYDYFFDETEGRFYLVMKYISGGDLAARLRANPEGRLDEKTVTEWAIQVADVLGYLHRQDPVIVYRDLKPANIMIDGNTGRLMLIDFGIARSINKEEKGVTAVGTMGYAPPELFSGNVEPRSDIYSLGSTMFHLLTGADPQSNPLLIFDFQKNPRPRQINPQLSDQIEQILMRSVEYSADLRFTSAFELKRSLEEHLVNLQAGKVSFGVKAVPSAVSFSEQLVFCGFCGKQIVASDVFCAFCGSQQPIAQQSFHQAPVLAPSTTAKLYVVLTNDLESAGFTIEKDDNLIGRRDPMSNIFPEVDLSKYDPQTKISRRHARIRREGSNFMLEDLGSSNGTILMTGGDSSRLLPHQSRLLTNGDRFRVGDTTLQFSMA